MGEVLGGFQAAMLYDTLGPALIATLGPEEFQVTLDLNATFVRTTRPGRLTGWGRVVRRDGDVAFLEATLTDVQDVVIATATATARVIPLQLPTTQQPTDPARERTRWPANSHAADVVGCGTTVKRCGSATNDSGPIRGETRADSLDFDPFDRMLLTADGRGPSLLEACTGEPITTRTTRQAGPATLDLLLTTTDGGWHPDVGLVELTPAEQLITRRAIRLR